MSGTHSRDGWTDNTLFRTCGMQHKHFGSSSNGTIVKTEAPGLRGVGWVLEPQAWPGTSLPHPAPFPDIYSRNYHVGGKGQLERRKQEGQGREQART